MCSKPVTVERSDSFGHSTRLTLFPNPEHICSGWRALKNPLSSLSCGQGRVSGRGAASEFRAHLEPITALASDLEMGFLFCFSVQFWDSASHTGEAAGLCYRRAGDGAQQVHGTHEKSGSHYGLVYIAGGGESGSVWRLCALGNISPVLFTLC